MENAVKSGSKLSRTKAPCCSTVHCYPATCLASDSEDSPLRGALGPGDLQQVVVVLQLEVGEHQGDGVSWLGQHRPGAVGVVVVLGRVVGRRDGAALTPQGPAAAVIRCGWQKRGEEV